MNALLLYSNIKFVLYESVPFDRFLSPTKPNICFWFRGCQRRVESVQKVPHFAEVDGVAPTSEFFTGEGSGKLGNKVDRNQP